MNQLWIKWQWTKNKIVEGLKDESGMGVIEIAIIIIVLIAIAMLFRDKIWALVNSLMEQMDVSSVKNAHEQIVDSSPVQNP